MKNKFFKIILKYKTKKIYKFTLLKLININYIIFL